MVWQTGTIADSVTPELSFHAVLGPRTVVSGVLALGLLYLSLITVTMRRYGDVMDQAWKARVKSWAEEIKAEEENNPTPSVTPIRIIRVRPRIVDEKTGYPSYRVPVVLDHTGYPGPTHRHQDGWPSTQTPMLVEPRPAVPFVDASSPGLGHGSAVSLDLYQERYRTPPSSASRSAYGYGYLEKVVPPKLPLPASDDRVFRKREYIDLQVSRWLNQVTPHDASEEQGRAPPDSQGDELQPVEKWLAQVREYDGVSEYLSPYSPPPKDSDDRDHGEGTGQKLEIPDSIAGPGEERVASQLSRADLEQSDTLPVYKHHPLEMTPNQHGETTPQVGPTPGVPAENIHSTPLEIAQVGPEEPTHDASDLSPPSIREVQIPDYVESSSSSASTSELHHKESQAQLNDPALQLTPMNGLQSTVNMQLGTYRILPYPKLGAQGFSKEGNLAKVHHLHSTRAGDEVSPTQGSKSAAVMPKGISPQVWHTFISVCCEMPISVSLLFLTFLFHNRTFCPPGLTSVTGTLSLSVANGANCGGHPKNSMLC